MKLKELMTTDVYSVTPDSSIKETAELMRKINVGSIPVCEGRKPVGIITDRDIVIRNVAGNGNPNTPVRQIMTENPVCGTPEMSDDEAMNLMAEKQIRRLPVVEDGQLVGIVSLGDLAVNEMTDMEAARALTDISVPSKPKGIQK
ncbi:MAG: CBS domain-containing protein [Halanaerobiaceae bacterium]|jgi:CBS domain-containing protein|nr:CBS domain-containing protein [Halanaerobiaceae bacterium]